VEPDLSSPELSTLVEHMRGDLALMRQRITQGGPLSPADRVAAAQHIKTLAATLGNLYRVISRTASDSTVEGEAHGHT